MPDLCYQYKLLYLDFAQNSYDVVTTSLNEWGREGWRVVQMNDHGRTLLERII